jgi:hypothetical protein
METLFFYYGVLGSTMEYYAAARVLVFSCIDSTVYNGIYRKFMSCRKKKVRRDQVTLTWEGGPLLTYIGCAEWSGVWATELESCLSYVHHICTYSIHKYSDRRWDVLKGTDRYVRFPSSEVEGRNIVEPGRSSMPDPKSPLKQTKETRLHNDRRLLRRRRRS